MALYGKSALDLFKEIAQCPAEILPPYNVSLQSFQLASEPGNTRNPCDLAGRACASCADRDTRAQGPIRHSLLVSTASSCVFPPLPSSTHAFKPSNAVQNSRRESKESWCRQNRCVSRGRVHNLGTPQQHSAEQATATGLQVKLLANISVSLPFESFVVHIDPDVMSLLLCVACHFCQTQLVKSC